MHVTTAAHVRDALCYPPIVLKCIATSGALERKDQEGPKGWMGNDWVDGCEYNLYPRISTCIQNLNPKSAKSVYAVCDL